MKKYIIIFDQGGGCDYTIGCGIQIFEIEANNLNEVKTELEKKLRSYRSPEYRIETITILDVNKKISIEPDVFYDIYDLEDKREKERGNEDEERKLYEKLKEKYDE